MNGLTDAAAWAWLAGLYEGEGCINAQWGRGRPVPHVQMRIAMTDLDVLEKARDLAGMGRLTGPYQQKGSCKPRWVWSVARWNDVLLFVERVMPHLCARRRAQAEAALAARRNALVAREAARPTVEERFWAKVDRSKSCWLWLGARSWNGYALFAMGRQGKLLAHRYAYELSRNVTLAPKDRLVNECGERLCVRSEGGHWSRQKAA